MVFVRVTLPILEMHPPLNWRLEFKQTIGKEQEGDQQGKENFGQKFIDLGSSVSYGKKKPNPNQANHHHGIIKLPTEQRTSCQKNFGHTEIFLGVNYVPLNDEGSNSSTL